jgi:polyadenylate-binding protein 2
MAAEGQEIPEEIKGEKVPAQEDGVDDEVSVIGVAPLH